MTAFVTELERAPAPAARPAIGWRVRLVLLLALACLLAMPFAGSDFYINLLTRTMLLAVFAMSLDLLVGHSGLVSLGHAAYFGLGAYVAALTVPEYEPGNLWTTLLLATAVAAAAALVVGFFVLRTTGIYFIMVTLAFAQMMFFLFHDTPLGRGTDGVYINVKPATGLGFLDLDRATHFYWLALAVLLLAFFLLRRLMHSSFGSALAGIRENEHRMRFLGYPTFAYKLAAFTLAGALAGLAGCLLAFHGGFVNPELLNWQQSGDALFMVILGGMGQFYGAALGAFLFAAMQEGFGLLTKHWHLLMGVVIVLLVLVAPRGVAGLLEGRRDGRQ
ncbi:MAG: branched-chain amino acid ABC transporter permease [Burkholderiaceae bacterium]